MMQLSCNNGKSLTIFVRMLHHRLNLVLDTPQISAANKYYSSASHHEQKNKNISQIKFLAVTIKQWIKLVLQHSSFKKSSFIKKTCKSNMFIEIRN